MSGERVSVGIDLAWGDDNPTGLCVAVGRNVLTSTTLRMDDEIIAWVRPWIASDTIVAVDAPLVVTNITGQRTAERLVSTLFGGAGASAHSSNRSMRQFADGGRAARLAGNLGLSVDPNAATPMMVEVYPHPAIVGTHLPRQCDHQRLVGSSPEKAGPQEAVEAL